jgi:hypothetical protein
MGNLGVRPAEEWRPPERFDDYRLILPLGRGSFGESRGDYFFGRAASSCGTARTPSGTVMVEPLKALASSGWKVPPR